MVEVLSRIPVKTLLRFRCVSKEFLGLISSPTLKQVRDLHLLPTNPKNHHHKFVVVWNFSHIFQRQLREINPYAYPPENGNENLTLYVINALDGKLQSRFELTVCYSKVLFSGSCHGLIYFCDLEAAKEILYVCNPSTRVLIKLTEPPSASLRAKGSRGAARIGMGYLPESNTYKVVVWFIYAPCCNWYEVKLVSGFEIFTLTDGGSNPGSSPWRSLEMDEHPDFGDDPRIFCLASSLSVNGVIYWMNEIEWHTKTIGAFDLRTEEYRSIQPPANWHYEGYNKTNMGELRGSLCVAERFSKGNKTIIWVLRDQDDGWVQQYNIPDLYFGCWGFGRCFFTFVPSLASDHHGHDGHAAQWEEEDLDLVFMEEGSMDLRYYNTRNKCISARTKPSPGHNLYGHRSYLYFDTLFNPGTSRMGTQEARQ